MSANLSLSAVARELGIDRSTLYRHPEVLHRLKAKAPIGRLKYAAVQVERLKHDESLTQIGRRRA